MIVHGILIRPDDPTGSEAGIVSFDDSVGIDADWTPFRFWTTVTRVFGVSDAMQAR